MAARGWRPQPASAGFVLLACRFSGRRRGALLPSRLLGAAPAFLLAFRPCALVHDLSPGCFVRFPASPPRPGPRRVGGGRQRQAVLPCAHERLTPPRGVIVACRAVCCAPLSTARLHRAPPISAWRLLRGAVPMFYREERSRGPRTSAPPIGQGCLVTHGGGPFHRNLLRCSPVATRAGGNGTDGDHQRRRRRHLAADGVGDQRLDRRGCPPAGDAR
jgi:hypothetical protein